MESWLPFILQALLLSSSRLEKETHLQQDKSSLTSLLRVHSRSVQQVNIQMAVGMAPGCVGTIQVGRGMHLFAALLVAVAAVHHVKHSVLLYYLTIVLLVTELPYGADIAVLSALRPSTRHDNQLWVCAAGLSCPLSMSAGLMEEGARCMEPIISSRDSLDASVRPSTSVSLRYSLQRLKHGKKHANCLH